jgi:DNA-binding response OmpR family regulator
MALVLVVDADPDNSIRLQKALELAGYEVSVASSGTSALTTLRRRRPDLVLSQSVVDDMYGSELLSDIRGDRTSKEIPVILFVDRAAQMGVAATRTEADMILPDNSPVATIVTRVGTLLQLRGVQVGAPARDSGQAAAVEAPEAAPVQTLQGSLAVMDMTEVAQAVSIGKKSGRLVLSLPAGEGVILFETGWVVHAEFGGETGEKAFNAIVMTSHQERSGSFSFTPMGAKKASDLPKTIQKDLETLLLNVAVEIDEIAKDKGS